MTNLRTLLCLTIAFISISFAFLLFSIPGAVIIYIASAIAAGYTAAIYSGKIPIERFRQKTDMLSKGILPEKTEGRNQSAWAALEKSMDHYVEMLKSRIDFSNELSRGNLEATLENSGTEDALGTALTGIRDNLLKVRTEEDRRTWATTGLASLSEILRTNSDDLYSFGDHILPSVIKYIKANQGNLYIADYNEKHLKLVSSYAYNRKKHITDTIEFGEGLAGQCVLEKEIIFLTEIPDNYLKITSGLGESNPRCIAIVPLVYNDEVKGVLELATFTVFEDYQIEFLKKLSESIASSVNNISVNENTRNLLRQSQVLTEELRSQEEELRQNMEELQAAQEEILRREQETQRQLKMVQHEYENQLKEIALQKEELMFQKNMLHKALHEDSLLIDITGRNRYLSQKMGFLCEMICNGKEQHRKEVQRIVKIHDQSLYAVKYGGTPPDMNKKCVFPPASDDIIDQIRDVEETWQIYKRNIEIIIQADNISDSSSSNRKGLRQEISDALEIIEETGGEMLRRNNELVQACIRMNEKTLAEINA